ncbi:hypothetical protein LTR56_025007 [Elasticomyces elasticus]|nr:hypothetical protein LTR56_025007 [Elasticomyces elasticus]KAK3645811.1 hypothetical protein LTR22_014579 [Elasticomyces elasticus]KAK4906612.1 hypothetical protein LTR49_024259 [Elasticomyces elasticus]
MEQNGMLRRAQDILQYIFQDETLLLQALTAAHRIELDGGQFQSFENNKRLAAIGESVMKLILTEDWLVRDLTCGFERSPIDRDAAALHALQIRLLSNHALGVVATQSGIGSCILRSERQDYLEEAPPSTQYIAIRAIIGAVWCNTAYDQATTRAAMEVLGCVISIKIAFVRLTPASIYEDLERRGAQL